MSARRKARRHTVVVGSGAPGPHPRVLHVTRPVDAGVAVMLADLARYQCELGWEVHVACPPAGYLVDRLRRSAVQLQAWSAGRLPGPALPREIRALANVVDAVRPDVVHLHSAKAGLAGRLVIRGRVPTLFQPHAWSFHAAGGLLRMTILRWERFATRWTDLLIAVSQDELDEGLRLGIRAARSTVISNGVDVRRFTPTDRLRARERLRLGTEPLALVIGRLTHQKGQDLALAAWPRIRSLVPTAHLAIVGDGPRRADLVTRLPAGASLHGAVPDPRDWFAAADVVLLPSRWEGMALVPLEAMASGRSVVGFDVAGVAESIAGAGAVLPPGDVEALADAVVARLADPGLTEREGRRGRIRAEQYFDRADTLDRLSAAVVSLLDDTRPEPRTVGSRGRGRGRGHGRGPRT